MLDFLEDLSDEIDPPSLLQPFYSLCPELDNFIPIASSVVDNPVKTQAPVTRTKQKAEGDVDIDLEDFLASLIKKDKIKYKKHKPHKIYIKELITKKWIEYLKQNPHDAQDDTLGYYKNTIFQKLENTKSIKRDICQKRMDRTVTKGVYDEKIRHINTTLSLVAEIYEKFPSLKEKRTEKILKQIEKIALRKPRRLDESKGKPILTSFDKKRTSDPAHHSRKEIVPPLAMELRKKP